MSAAVGRQANKPDRAVVERIVAGVSAEYRVPVHLITAARGSPQAMAPRVESWRRILRQTGCTIYGLSLVWGCDRQSIRRNIRRADACAPVESPAGYVEAVRGLARDVVKASSW